ncbi:MAG: tRNA (adenosine(37)-N6)-threonylcarbamoyltransferase complex dimerization subunit type 1 TsaB [Brachymonas sp.]|nr:tRNA (adenosine(37)-N6)-threonylcarbamoyltransferase complex dimerization subunit type 1 TsaB [Brachymonas sp.]
MPLFDSSAPAPYFLAIDTSTEVLSIALGTGASARDSSPPLWQYTGAGGSHSSATLIPEAMRLLAQAGLRLQDVLALVVGIGPGSFTGLRTACAVAQGLALGAGTPVLPISTLLAVAEDWRARQAAQQAQGRVWALLDARMDEIYAACWQWRSDAAQLAHAAVQWQCVQAPVLVAPEDLLALPGWQAEDAWAGNVQAVYGQRLPRPVKTVIGAAMPTAAALLRLAPALWQQGAAVDAALLLPHYVRDKVAQTTAERAAERAAAQAAAAQAQG